MERLSVLFDASVCQSVSASVRMNLKALLCKAMSAYDRDDSETAEQIIDQGLELWAKHSTYTQE